MNSRNQKQEELIRRLEEIRRQRSTIQSETNEQKDESLSRMDRHNEETPRRNVNRQQRNRQSTQRNRMENQRRNTPNYDVSPRQEPAPYDYSNDTLGQSPSEPQYSDYKMQDEINDQIKGTDLTRKAVTPKKEHKNALLNQLSNKDSIRQAIILNEVLSKPIAMRRHSR